MGVPVLPVDVCNATPGPADLVCNKIKALFRLAELMCQFWNYAFTSSGGVSDAFAALFVRIGVPVGGLIDFAYGGNVPVGFLVCNGQAVSRVVYANLYSVIGDTHGSGDNSTTFNVPDYSDTYRVGSSASVAVGGVPFGNLASTVSLDAANNGPHTHRAIVAAQGANAYNVIWGSDPNSPNGPGDVYANNHGLAVSGTSETPKATTLEASGSGTAFDIRPRSKAVLVLIKY